MKLYPVDVIDFQDMFPTDDACFEYLRLVKWPDGFICPHCNHVKFWKLKIIPTKAASRFTELSHGDVEEFFTEYYMKHFSQDGSGWRNLFKIDRDKYISSIKNLLDNCRLYELAYSVGNQDSTIEFIDKI